MRALKTILLLIFLSPALLINMAQAQEAQSYKYSPPDCDFAISFPSEPYIVKRCDENDAERCYNLVSYTKVFDMATTVNFRVICSPISADVHEQYSGEVMAATLRAMTQRSVIKEFDTTFREEEKFKIAGLVGEGRVGKTPTIYLAQLWISENSSFSIEAELIGDVNEPADLLFSNVLRSAGFTGDGAEETQESEKAQGEEQPSSEPQPAP